MCFDRHFMTHHRTPDLFHSDAEAAFIVVVSLKKKCRSVLLSRWLILQHLLYRKQRLRGCRYQLCLTLLVGCEKDAEAALAAGLVCPHADDAQRWNQHDVVGHRGAELAFQVFHRTEMKQDGEKSTQIAIKEHWYWLCIHHPPYWTEAQSSHGDSVFPSLIAALYSGYLKIINEAVEELIFLLNSVGVNDSIIAVSEDIKYCFLWSWDKE